MTDLLAEIFAADYAATIVAAGGAKSKKPALRDRSDDEIDGLVIDAIRAGVTGWEAICRHCRLREDGLCDALVRLMLDTHLVGCRYTGRFYDSQNFKDLEEREYFLTRKWEQEK